MSVIEPNLRKGTCVRARRAVLLAAAISVVIAVVAVSGGTAGAARGCGYIRVPGAIVNVHVRGAVSCRTARSVMTRIGQVMGGVTHDGRTRGASLPSPDGDARTSGRA
jgi:hypothetical protein